MWWGSSGYAWGMPFMMFLFPMFFLFCIGMMFFFFNRGRCPFGRRNHDDTHTDKELLEEIRKLRQDVEDLKKEKKQQ